MDLTTLTIQQLSEVKKQVDEGDLFVPRQLPKFSELEHLSQSFAQLRQARHKFLDCVKTIRESGTEDCDGNAEFKQN